MTRSTSKKLVGLALILIIAAAAGILIGQSQGTTVRVTIKRTTQREFSSAVFNPNGKYLATVGDNAVIQIWDATNGKLLHELFPPSGPNQIDPYFARPSVVFDSEGDTLISEWAGLTTHWDTVNGKLIRRLDGVGLVQDPILNRSPRILRSEIDNVIAHILASSTETNPISGETFQSDIAAFSVDGRQIATLRSSREALDVWSLETEQRLFTLSATANRSSDSDIPLRDYDVQVPTHPSN